MNSPMQKTSYFYLYSHQRTVSFTPPTKGWIGTTSRMNEDATSSSPKELDGLSGVPWRVSIDPKWHNQQGITLKRMCGTHLTVSCLPPGEPHVPGGMIYRDSNLSSPNELDGLSDVPWRVSIDPMWKPTRHTRKLMCGTHFDGFMPPPGSASKGWYCQNRTCTLKPRGRIGVSNEKYTTRAFQICNT